MSDTQTTAAAADETGAGYGLRRGPGFRDLVVYGLLLAGFIAGWMAMLDSVLIPAAAYLFSGIAMNSLVPEVSRWEWTALAVVVTTVLNLWGVRAAARVGFLVLAMEIVVLLVFAVSAVVVLARDGAQRGPLSPLTGDGSQGAFALSGSPWSGPRSPLP